MRSLRGWSVALALVAGGGVAEAQTWTAQWIWPGSVAPNQWAAFRKTFSLPSMPTSAPTRIAADSKYWLYVNGTLVVFEGGLKNGPTPTGTYYDEVDLAPYLTAGGNKLAILVWHFGKDGFSHKNHGGGLLFESLVSAGGPVSIASDASWRAEAHLGYTNDGSGTQPNYRLPESNVSYDATLGALLEGWTSPGYPDAGWPAASVLGVAGAAPWNELVRRPTPLFRFSGLRDYVNAGSFPTFGTDSAPVVATLPSNLQLTPYLQVDAPAGVRIEIQTDHYQDGGVANLRSSYVTRAGVQEFESPGWMSGTAVHYRIPSSVKILALRYRESGYDTSFAGSFVSSDPFFDELWQKAARTVYLNMRDGFMDCPTRERAQWWGDVVNESRAAYYAFDTRVQALVEKAIAELIAWRKPAGELFSPVPAGNWTGELPAQMLASIWSLWGYHLHTGDADFAATAYPAIEAYLDLWALDAGGLVAHRPGDVPLQDWLDWGTNVDQRLIENAWYFMALDTATRLAPLAGHPEDVPTWGARRDSLRTAFNPVLWNSALQEYRSPGYSGDTDDRGNALAVVAGLAGPDKFSALVRVLSTHANASPYMELYVLEALYRMGAPGAAEARMKSRYAAQVAGPGFTLWELWNPLDGGTDNHGWNSGPLVALSAYAAGVRPTSAGYATYEVTPQMGSLPSIAAVVRSVRGDIGVGLSTPSTTSFALTLSSPGGTQARVGIPLRGLADLTVAANGTTVFSTGSSNASVPGLSYAGVDSRYVYFEVGPGAWTFAASGVPAPAPTISSVAPASGPVSGGNEVTVHGSGFQEGATVRFGNSVALVTGGSADSVTVLAPAGAAGPVDVSIANPNLQAAILAGGYRYRVTVDSFTISPAIVAAPGSATLSWSTSGAVSIQIAGVGGFGPTGQASVSFAGTTTYTLTATGADGSAATRQVTIDVLPAPGVGLSLPSISAPTSGMRVIVSGVSFAWQPVAGATGYDLRVFDDATGAAVFSGSLQGAAATSTLVSLPSGRYLFAVRACDGAFADASCGSFATVDFQVEPARPRGAPSITLPIYGSRLQASTQSFSWTPVAKAVPSLGAFYELLLQDLQHGVTTLQIAVPDSVLSTVASLSGSTLYRLRVRACQASCGPWSEPVDFSVSLPTVPTQAPTVTAAALSGSDLTVSWTSVAGADLYQIQVVQPVAGPGGGALTVAARQVAGTTVTVPVPTGAASIFAAACNGNGCGPLSAPFALGATGPGPALPNLGTPMAGTVASGPTVLFTWNRVPGDTGANTTYRLYVQDLSRQAAALDVYTRANYYAAYFKAEGARYDALVIANPGPTQVMGPAAGFNVSGASSSAPTMVQPAHDSSVQQGNIQLGWSPVPGATLYEYFVAVQGEGQATVRGVTPGLFVQVPLSARNGQPTVYSGIVRACPAGATCVSGSDAGWGPWSVNAGPGVTNFSVTVSGAGVLSWGDQGDGSYRNPILKADFSDPDVIRVGEDFYLVGSDFHFMGMQVLHSKDLVNWRILGQVFPSLKVHERYNAMDGYGQGTWAPSIRYHGGKYRIYACTPAEGLFLWEADHPAGPWSDTITVRAVQLWEDPCPFWDDDGKAYLVRSVVGAGSLILHRMSPDGRTLLDDGTEVYTGPVAEGPKLFKRGGHYYISLPEGGVDNGWQTVLRATNIYGPYESKVVLPAGSPHQGGLVDLPDGTSWFIGFKTAGHLGRISHLEPVRWGADNWPVFGDGGMPVQAWRKPNAGGGQPVSRPRVSDEFDETRLDPVWQWNHNPLSGAWSVTERPGFLRLKANPASATDLARNTLTQKIWDVAGTIDVRMLVGGMADGQIAGFTFISGRSFGWIGVRMESGVRRVAWFDGLGPQVTGDEVYLRGRYEGDSARLLYSLDGLNWADAGSSFTLRFEHWKGVRAGLLSFGPGGTADFDWFRYSYKDQVTGMPGAGMPAVNP